MTVVGSVELDVGIRRASVDSAINGLRRRFAGLDELDIGVQVNRQALASEAARIERAFQDVDSRITPDVDTRSVSRASAVVTGIFQGIGQQVTSILTDAIARGIRSAVNVPVASVGLFAELDTALVQFESRARGSVSSSEELARVSALVADEAERIGIETSKTPQEVARIATRMVELGASAEEAAGNVDGVVAALEATGFTDIDKTAKAFQAGANIFGETSDDLADKIALLASSTAVTSATDIEQAFGKAGGQFRATGQSVDALLAIFAKFRETSEPEVAATSTRNALQKLIPSTDRARAALADLGVSLFDDSGDALPIIDVLEQLEQRVSGLTDRQASNVLLQIFDARSASQIQLLLGGLDDVRSTFNALENDSAGFAQSATDSLNQGVNAAVNRLGGSLTTLGTKFGEALGGGRGGPIELAIRGTQDAINQIIEAVNTQDLFGNIQESVGNLSSALGSVFSADNFADGLISALNIVDVAISNVVNNLADFIETNPGALANLAERIGAIGRIALDVGSALINASFAIAGFFEQSGINDAVTQALTGVAGAISLIADRISSVNTDELVRIAPVAAAAAVAIGKLVQVSQVVPNLIRSAASGLSNFFNNLDTFAESEGLIGGAAQVFLSLKDAVSAAVEAGQGIINVFSPAIDLFVNSGIAGIQAFLSAAQSLAEPFINAAAAVLNFTANAAFQEITKRLQQAEELAKDVKAFVGAVDAVDAPDFASGASDSVDLATASITQGFENIAEQRVAIDEAANSEELENFEELQSEKAAAQEKALNEFKDASTAAIREIESEQAEVLRSIGEQQLSGADPGQLALARIDAEREAANQIIAERERQLSALKEAEAAGTIAADAAAQERISIEQSLGQALDSELQARIDRQEELTRQQVSSIESQFAELSSQLSSQTASLDIDTAALGRQQNLLSAQQALQDAIAEGAQAELQARIDSAKAAGDQASASALISELEGNRSAALEQAQRIASQSLRIDQEQRRSQAIGVGLQAELNSLKAQEALLIAQAEGAEQGRIDILQSSVDIAQQQVDAAQAAVDSLSQLENIEIQTQAQQFDNEQAAAIRDAEAAQRDLNDSFDQGNKKRLDGLQAVADAEQALIDTELEGIEKVAAARAQAISSLFSAISQQSSTSQEDAISAIDDAQERLNIARQAGFFSGQEGGSAARESERALRQVERLISSEASDQRLANAAFQNRDNDAFLEALRIAGRGDIASLADAEESFDNVAEVQRQAAEDLAAAAAALDAAAANINTAATAANPGEIQGGFFDGRTPVPQADGSLQFLTQDQLAASIPQQPQPVIPASSQGGLSAAGNVVDLGGKLDQLIDATESRPVQAGGNTFQIFGATDPGAEAQRIALEQVRELSRGL